MRIEARQILLDRHRGVALRVDREEDRTHAISIRAEIAKDLRHFEQGGRADIGAVSEAKEGQERPAPELLLGHRLPILIDEPERPTNGGDLRTARRERAHCQQDDRAAQHKAADESAQHEKEANVARCHGVFQC